MTTGRQEIRRFRLRINSGIVNDFHAFRNDIYTSCKKCMQMKVSESVENGMFEFKLKATGQRRAKANADRREG